MYHFLFLLVRSTAVRAELHSLDFSATVRAELGTTTGSSWRRRGSGGRLLLNDGT